MERLVMRFGGSLLLLDSYDGSTVIRITDGPYSCGVEMSKKEIIELIKSLETILKEG